MVLFTPKRYSTCGGEPFGEPTTGEAGGEAGEDVMTEDKKRHEKQRQLASVACSDEGSERSSSAEQ